MTTVVRRFRFLVADDVSMYAVTSAGELLWWPAWTAAAAAPPDIAAGVQITEGWTDVAHVVAGGGGILYVVRSDGALLWYQDVFRDGTNAPDGSTGWAANSGSPIAAGWAGFGHVVSGGGGHLYGVTPGGTLHWHHDVNRDGTANWAANSGNQIDSGWTGLLHVVGGGGGVFYAVDRNGDVRWHRDDLRDGSNAPDGSTGWAANSGSRVNRDWDFLTHLFSGEDGVLVAVRTWQLGGELQRWEDQLLDGSNTVYGGGWGSSGLSGGAWQVIAVEGYCWPLAAAPGEAVDFHVSASTPGAASVSYVRLGGRGPRMGVPVAAGPDIVCEFRPQGAYDRDCGWPVSFTLTLPSGTAAWEPGFYAARVHRPQGPHYDIPFVVSRAAEPAPLALLVNTHTWTAYNAWGGASNYTNDHPNDMRPLTMKRPNHHLLTNDRDHPDAEHLLRSEVWLHSWLLASGYRLDLYTDIDLHDTPGLLTGYKALVLSTHPEYWTPEMIAAVTAYLDAGGSVLYLGGNAMYRPTYADAEQPGGEIDRITAVYPGQWGTYPTYGGTERWLLAADVGNLTGPGAGTGLEIRDVDHRFMPGRIAVGNAVGTSGWNGVYGASGNETDHWENPPPDVAVLALDTTTASGGAQIACYETAAGGFVLGAGSITFVGALMEDAVLQGIVHRALAEALGH